MSEHTKGLWSVETYDGGSFDISVHGPYYVICSRTGHSKRADEAHANARLIAAAPDLLALAKQYASECEECGGSGEIRFIGETDAQYQCNDCAHIRAVIDKATGATP